VKLEDPDVELYVEEALSRDPQVESSEITVTSRDGVVELYGTVDSKGERERAAKVASRVLGVRDVKNDLTIREIDRPSAMRSDEALTAAVEQALDPEFPKIEVLVERGVVTLRGVVPSPEARQRAAKLAFAAGATLLRNEITPGGSPPPPW
jgi:osmotically-inducible protein OsmY